MRLTPVEPSKASSGASCCWAASRRTQTSRYFLDPRFPTSLIQLLLCGADGPAIHRRGDCSGDLRDGYLLLGGEAEAVQFQSRLLGDQRRLASLGLSPPSSSWTCTLCIYCSPVCLLWSLFHPSSLRCFPLLPENWFIFMFMCVSLQRQEQVIQLLILPVGCL